MSRPSGGVSGYTVIWAVLALGAAGYMATLALKPDWFAFPTAKHETTPPETNEGQRAAAKALAEADALRKRLQSMQATVRTLNTEMAKLRSREELAAARIASLEEEAVVAKAELERVKAEAAKQELARKALAKKAAAAPPRAKTKTAKPKPVARRTSVPTKAKVTPSLTLPNNWVHKIETGSLPTTIVPPSPPINRYAVQLSAGPSPDALRLSWSLLNERHRQVLGGLQPRYRSSGAAGSPATRYQLLAGPFTSASQARRACETLQARQVSCSPAIFSGNAL